MGLGILGLILLLASSLITATTHLNLNSLLKPLTKHQIGGPVSSAQYTFNGTTGDTVNYIQLCLASDNTCNSCAAPITLINSGTPLSFNTSYSISKAAIAAFLNGESAGSYNIGMYVASSNPSCTTPGASPAYCGTSQDNSGSSLCMQADYNSESQVIHLSQTDNGAVTLNKPAQYLYLPDGAGPYYIRQCLFNQASGSLSGSCVSTPLSNIPSDIVFAIEAVSGTQYAYVTTPDSGESGVLSCGIEGSSGALSCTPSTSATFTGGDTGFTSPNQIAVTSSGGIQYAYITDGSMVHQCTLNVNGTLNTCSLAGGTTGITAPKGIAFATVGEAQYAYLIDYNLSSITSCTVDTNGLFNACLVTDTGLPMINPNGIAITTAINGSQYVYIVDNGSSQVDKCSINSVSGITFRCETQPIYSANPPNATGISFGVVNGTQYAYVSDFNSNQVTIPGGYTGGKIWQCSLDDTGTFTACNYTPLINPFWAITGNAAVAYMTVSPS